MCVGGSEARGRPGLSVADKQWPEPDTPWETQQQIETQTTEPEGVRGHVGYRSNFIQMAPLNHQFYHFGQFSLHESWVSCISILDCEL